jgi:hypothetical protein
MPIVDRPARTPILGGLAETLRAAPTTVPALVAIVLFLAGATDQAGYPLTRWAPGALVVLALLALAASSVPLRLAGIRTPVKIALACLAGYTALSFLSILWAPDQGKAWEGANRTLLYLLVFALFACWRQRGRSAAILLSAWTLAMIALAAFVALHVDQASTASLRHLLPEGRLVYPVGYPNANAAQWLMAFWPAVLLARSEHLPWGLRGVLAAGAVLLAEVALLSQSRGSLYATPVMVLGVFALLPGRVRTFAVLVPVALGIGAAAPAVLRVGDSLQGGQVHAGTLHRASAAMFAASLAVGLMVALGGAIEVRGAFSATATARVRRAVGAVAILALALLLVGGWVAAGNPVARVRHGWESFKGGYGANSASGSRLVSGLGSNRYDFYRVALNEFAAHPLVGVGADNFEQQYLEHGRSDETPHYPHSVELRTLSQTGVAGALLALVGLGAALLAGWRAGRSSAGGAHDPLGPAVALAALAGFVYWAVHGSVDWFWEFAGLGAPAFALLGLACSLAPASGLRHLAGRPAGEVGRPGRRGLLWRRLWLLGALMGASAATVSLAAPWLSLRQVQSAARIWPRAPLTAYARLDSAARLNPLSDEAYLVAGSIALRFGDLRRADHEFSLALRRTPTDAYATLERGAIASSEGNRARALPLLEKAVYLDPRNLLAGNALLLARQGKRVDVGALNRSILFKARQLS